MPAPNPGISSAAPARCPRSSSRRTNSSAYRGLPPERSSSVRCVSAGRTARSSSVVMRRAVSSSVSGARLIVVALRSPAAQRRMLLVQLGTGCAEEEQRHSFRPVGQVLEEGEQRGVRPVQILEHEDRLPALCPRLEGAAPGGEGLLLGGGVAARAHEWLEAGLEPGEVGIVVRQGSLELYLCLSRRVGLEDAAFGLDDLSERPEGDPVPVGKASALSPTHEPGAVLEVAEQLGGEAALAHARLAHNRHQLTGALLGGALERPDEERLLEFPADERSRVRAGHVRAEAGAGLRAGGRGRAAPSYPSPRPARAPHSRRRAPYAERFALSRRSRSQALPPAGARRC